MKDSDFLEVGRELLHLLQKDIEGLTHDIVYAKSQNLLPELYLFSSRREAKRGDLRKAAALLLQTYSMMDCDDIDYDEVEGLAKLIGLKLENYDDLEELAADAMDLT